MDWPIVYTMGPPSNVDHRNTARNGSICKTTASTGSTHGIESRNASSTDSMRKTPEKLRVLVVCGAFNPDMLPVLSISPVTLP